VFAETFSRLVSPRAAALEIAPDAAALKCSVFGDFTDERTAVAYCLAYAWSHFASFKDALHLLGLQQAEFGTNVLVVDIGCGPATALVAFGEWLYAKRGQPTSIQYIGVDRSEHMRNLAMHFAHDQGLFEPYEPMTLASTRDITADLIAQKAEACDHVVILLSYVMHQQFMRDENVLDSIIRCFAGTKRPIWVLAQDANKPQVDEANVEWWPENRLRVMLQSSEAHGYRPRLWSRRFEAVKYSVDALGRVTQQPRTQKMGTKAIAARLLPS
jgi:SAM-dependent methyltransferase